MINLVWVSSFKKDCKRVVVASPYLKFKITQALETFTDNPHHPSSKLSGKLKGLWAFVVAYDCRVVFQFLDERHVLLIDIGKHDEVY
jgi:mRNA-degrading endonuclease YafQ of YafQ-DinJ toxin-antitoxin module